MEEKSRFEALVGEIQKFDKFKKETIRKNYDDIAWKYDEKIFAYEYPDPKKCADVVDSLGLSKDSPIFDMGWGTGLVGLYLAENGFINIDGVDASPGMLGEAKIKKVYNLLEELFLGNPETFPGKYKEKYDAITCTGVLLHEHCGPEIFDEMLLALKLGGYAVFSTRVAFIESNCHQRMDELVAAGKWEFISKDEFSRHDNISKLVEGFKPVQAVMYVYRKL